MAEKGASSIVRKPEEESSSRPPNPLLSILSKFTQVFNFPFPPPSTPTAEKDAVKKVETERKGNGSEVVEVSKKPVFVRFPDARTTTAVPPLKLEGEEQEMEQDTNPVLLWQVYAIGGFFVLRWALARWKERRANNKSSNASDSPSPPPPPGGGADEASE